MTELMVDMSENNATSGKGSFEAKVSSNKQIRPHFYKLNLTFSGDAARVFATCRPGQFAELEVSDIPLPPEEKIPHELLDKSSRNIILRRPFSFTDVTTHGDKTVVDILYCVLGPATLRMTTLSAGKTINVIGPLGNGFHVPEDKKYAFLIAGGMGTPPLQHLAKVLSNDYPEVETYVFAGAKTKIDLPVEGKLDDISQFLGFSLPEFTRYSIESMLATDDGSIGYKGFVTDLFTEWLEGFEFDPENAIIYACGPEQMLAKVSKITREKKIDCQVSMERRMACGIGLCQGCAIECKSANSNVTEYKMCCKDGPVFNSSEVVFKC